MKIKKMIAATLTGVIFLGGTCGVNLNITEAAVDTLKNIQVVTREKDVLEEELENVQQDLAEAEQAASNQV